MVISLPGALAHWPLAGGGEGSSEWSQCRDRKSKHRSLGHAGLLGRGWGWGGRMGQGPRLISASRDHPSSGP